MTYTSIPTVAVTARVYTQDGKAVAKALVALRLTTAERYGGYIVPREIKVETDARGVAVLHIWPNELGTEGSEYRVSIRIPEGNGTRTVNGHAVVPNSDCDLSDIMELPGYEPRGAGAVIPAEVAGYAAQASSARDAAQRIFEATKDTETRLLTAATGAEAAKDAAQSASALAQQTASNAGELVKKATRIVESFEQEVVTRVDTEATKLTNKAVLAVTAAQNTALEDIDSRASEAIGEITEGVAGMKGDALNTIAVAKVDALAALDAAGEAAVTALQEEGALFEEDFKELLERAEYQAKSASCSAKNAAKHAQNAKETEERINERVKLFDSCVEVYEYAAVSKHYAGISEKSAASAQVSEERACECALIAEECSTEAQVAAQSAELASQSARADALSAHESIGIVRELEEQARVSADKASTLADQIDVGLLLSTKAYVEGLENRLEDYRAAANVQISALTLAAARGGKFALSAYVYALNNKRISGEDLLVDEGAGNSVDLDMVFVSNAGAEIPESDFVFSPRKL